MHRLLNTLLLIVGLWTGLACGGDTDDRMVRRYAKCMTDTNTALYRLTASSASGTVALSAEASGGTVAWSTGERGSHDGGRSGPTTSATVNRCGRELREDAVGKRRLDWATIRYQKASLQGRNGQVRLW